jgi:Raf kinase inhibitor-like YbhB/YbcL family protein
MMNRVGAMVMLAMVVAAWPAETSAQAAVVAFQLTSSDVKNGTFAPAQIYNGFGCSGGNVSPQLSWKGAPAGTQSFVVTVYDPDAPTGSGFWHWVVINLPAAATSLPTGVSRSGKLPAGAIETRTDFGAPGYGGPCPPAGDKPHRYIFTVHALKVPKLDLDAQASGAMVGFMVHSHTLGSATFTARYGR